MALAEQLQQILADNRLTAVSVHAHPRADGAAYFHAYAHDDGIVGMAHGASPADAVAAAIAQLNERRVPKVSVPALEAA